MTRLVYVSHAGFSRVSSAAIGRNSIAPASALYLALTGDCVRYAVSVRAAPVMAAVFKFAGVTLPEAAAWAALDTAPPTRAAASPFIHNAKLFMSPSRRNTRC